MKEKIFVIFIIISLLKITSQDCKGIQIRGEEEEDRRNDKSKLKISSYNVDNLNKDSEKLETIANIIRNIDPDIIQLNNIEDCETLYELNQRLLDLNFNIYMKEHFGLLTKINPLYALNKIENNLITYPIEGSTCNLKEEGVFEFKNQYYTIFNISIPNSDMKIPFIFLGTNLNSNFLGTDLNSFLLGTDLNSNFSMYSCSIKGINII
jgi:hypothetical protein